HQYRYIHRMDGNNNNLVVLIFGSTGWMGGKLTKLMEAQSIKVIAAKSRLENRQDVESEIQTVKPNRIFNCAGLTGRPNIDWCEEHKPETIRANVIGHLNLMDLSHQYNVHLTTFATGCLYQYDETHPEGSCSPGFSETDAFNYTGSFYSRTKGIVEELSKSYNNILTLRVRLPISDDVSEDRNLVKKLIGYQRVINVKNSVSVLHDLLPVALDMSRRALLGVYNFVNPGVISHNELLDLYREHVDPNFTYHNFSLVEQAKVLKAGRCNCELDTSKLLSLYPDIPPISKSIVNVFQRMRQIQQQRQQ
ncbi:hypothetical protein SAMD00019534_030890, partial [Acytostelium subglobosum LB1]|uniref:hypothetical protein n=1 Tax=Acytostelium subglobosum LB1 TaxID=1410327 RepID=UPI000644F34B